MKKKTVAPTLENILKLFSERLKVFKGESRRSYQKALVSFQSYVIRTYPAGACFDTNILGSWIIFNLIQGLKINTVSFYLEKISSLYSAASRNLEGGRLIEFRLLKKQLKSLNPPTDLNISADHCLRKLKLYWKEFEQGNSKKNLLDAFLSFPEIKNENHKEIIFRLWALVALKSGVPAEKVRHFLSSIPPGLEILSLISKSALTGKEETEVLKLTRNSVVKDDPEWFAMRLRPKVKYEEIISRLSRISDLTGIPELFYPYSEIAKRVGGKVVWKGKPVISDIVFFKIRRNEIYPLFTHIYDLAWCYRTPGCGPGCYAKIPDKAMEEFRQAIGILSPDYELRPLGEMEMLPGDEVIILGGDFLAEKGKIIKKPTLDEDGNKIYRVRLNSGISNWEIGVDARLIRKA